MIWTSHLRNIYWKNKFYFRTKHLPSYLGTCFFRLNSTSRFWFHFTSVVVDGKGLYSNSKFSFLNSPGLYVQAKSYVFIGRNVLIGPGVKIVSSNHNRTWNARHENIASPPVVIGNNVWIGANAVILPGVQIGDNSIIGAGSVVANSFPENSLILGSKATFKNYI
jgi:acetyltransferase-like isoleucine patch superfamily enzyme